MAFKRTTCKHCRKALTPERPGQIVHTECAADYAIALGEKKARAEAKAVSAAAKLDRADTKSKLQAMAPIRDLVKDAQTAFNAYIRERDKDLPCVSCGVMNPSNLGVGGVWDAGHLLSRGAHPEKRFMEMNCWKQCKVCNAGSAKNPHKAMTVTQAYEQELIRRIGIDGLEKVRAPIPVKKLCREELLQIKDTYRQKLKELKKTG